jgi:UDP-2,4-diacetamido-2,4,6-trideoxy-beta-L-altropyranose hydrolase
MNQRIILRADANEKIATGHVYRLLAFAEILKPTYEVLFCTQTTNQQILDSIDSKVDQLIQLTEQFEYCLPSDKEPDAEIPFDLQYILQKDDIVITDGYWFGKNYQQNIKVIGAKLIMIDDFANQYFYADAVINHASGLTQNSYKGEPYTKYYLGLSYALIRKAFFEKAKTNHTKNSNAVFIAFGGSDPYRLSVKYTEYLLKHTTFDVHTLSSNLFSPTLLTEINHLKQLFGQRLNVYNNLSAKELILVLDKCNYGIVPSSTILYECLARGLKCITGYYTENQLYIYNGFLQEKNCVGLGDFRKHNEQTLKMALNEADKNIQTHLQLNSTTNLLELIKKYANPNFV